MIHILKRSAMKSCCKNMTPVTFQRISNRNFHPYHDEPAQLNMESITAIAARIDGMAHDLLMVDEEYVVIGRFRKSCKPLVGPGRFHLVATTTTAGDPIR